MNRARNRAGVALVGFLVLVSLLVGVGCASASPETRAYQAIAGTAQAVDLAMKAAGDLYRAGVISDVQKAEILSAHAKYQNVARIAVAGLRIGMAEGDLAVCVEEAQKAAIALVRLVDSLREPKAVTP